MAQTNSNNKSTTGMKAEERTISAGGSSGVASLGSYFQGISSYLPSSIKKQFYVSPPHFEEEKDVILGMSFDEYEDADGRQQYLLLSYTNGFQIWSINQPGGMKEVLSVREGPIKSIKFLPTPLGKEAPNSPLYGKRPLIAVVSAEESTKFPRSMVKLFSLKASDFVNAMRFKSPVYSIECNKRVLVVALRDYIYGFDLSSMERILSLPCYPSPLNNAVMSLGQRWLAYASNQPILPPSTSPAGTPAAAGNVAPTAPTLADVAKDVATDIAKEVAQGLFYLGDMGRKTVSSYLYPEEQSVIQPMAPQDYKDTEHAGTIIIYDIVLKKVLTHFRAHSQPLSTVKFDPTGTLLVTASVGGHNFNVFQIYPPPPSVVNRDSTTEGPQSYRHLYKLVRGVTNATIQDISFSSDSKWMAVSSTRGTTRIYFHLRHAMKLKLPNDKHKEIWISPTLVKLSVCSRIKHVTGVTKHEDGTMKVHHLQTNIGSTSYFVGQSPLNEQLYVMSQSGLLTLYQLQPHPPPPNSETDPSTLHLTVVPMSEWDVARRPRWPECKQFPASPKVERAEEREPHLSAILQPPETLDTSWLSSVEILTHSPYLRPLWVVPQFTFKTFHPSANLSSSPGSSSSLSPDPISQAFGKLNVSPTTTTTTTTSNMLYPTLPPNSPPKNSSKKNRKGKNAAIPNPAENNNNTTTTTTTTTTTQSNSYIAANQDLAGMLFDEHIPTKKIDIRRFEPMPFKENLDDSTIPFGMSPPHHSEEFVKEGLMAAISTPMMDIPKKGASKIITAAPEEPAGIAGIAVSPPFTIHETYNPIATTPPEKPNMAQLLKQNIQQPDTKPAAATTTTKQQQPITATTTPAAVASTASRSNPTPSRTATQPNPPRSKHENQQQSTKHSSSSKQNGKNNNKTTVDHNFGFEDLQFGQEEDEVL